MTNNQEQQQSDQQSAFRPHEEYFVQLHQDLYDAQVFRSKEIRHTGMFQRAVQDALNKFTLDQEAEPVPDGERETLEPQDKHADSPSLALALALDLAQALMQYNLVRCNPAQVNSLYRVLTRFTAMQQPFRYPQAVTT